MIISLGRRLPGASCNLPGSIGRAALKRFPIWFCSGRGLPCLPCRHESGGLLPRLFTLTGENAGGLFSVALSLRSPPVRVTNLPALRSPDFPPAAGSRRRSCTHSNEMQAKRKRGKGQAFLPARPVSLPSARGCYSSRDSGWWNMMRLQVGQARILSSFIRSL